ncbi:MAG: ATP-binding cassette domain-containing protein [Myxococcales bacterium]|nr:ATP-binding cassette domain-containing protein [Myxococcales bacterium]
MTQVALRNVYKRFAATEALRGANLELEPAEIHALLGENGAGKSTLVRVLYGLVEPDRGEVRIDDEPVSITSPHHALALGIGLVHQHFMGVPALSVAENLMLGQHGSLARRHAAACELLERYQLGLDPDRPAGELAVAEQQRLEIVRALGRDVKLLILDEPTAVLAPSEVELLLAWLSGLREEGRTVLLISHKLTEVSSLCDRVTVLRHGLNVITREVAGLDAAQLGRFMLGEAPPPPGQPPQTQPGQVALRLEAVRAQGLSGIELELRSGEILALGGIDGNGQGPLEQVLAGVRTLHSGSIELLCPPLALLSGERERTGLVLELAIEENLALPQAAHRHGFLSPRALRGSALDMLQRFGIRARPELPARVLSGGNQQKLCVARALCGGPGVLVAVNPTRGLDVAGTALVREEIRSLAASGCAVLLISTDLDEVLELGNRIAVFFRGALLPLDPAHHDRAEIGRLMLGEGAA